MKSDVSQSISASRSISTAVSASSAPTVLSGGESLSLCLRGFKEMPLTYGQRGGVCYDQKRKRRLSDSG